MQRLHQRAPLLKEAIVWQGLSPHPPALQPGHAYNAEASFLNTIIESISIHPALIAGRHPGKSSVHSIPFELQPEYSYGGKAVLISPVKASKNGTLQFIQEAVSTKTSAGKPITTLSRELAE